MRTVAIAFSESSSRARGKGRDDFRSALHLCFLQNNVDYATYILLHVLVVKVLAKYTVILGTKIHNTFII